MSIRWYGVHTISGHEMKVRDLIARRGEMMNLWNSFIFEILIPTEPELSTRNGKRVVIQKKIFPGYILIKADMTDDVFKLIKSTSGVTGFLQIGGKPVPLEDEEIQRIQRNLEKSEEAPKVAFEKGDIIRVTEGPFVDYTGKIEEVNAEREKLKVMINIFGRDTPVELDFTGVEKQ